MKASVIVPAYNSKERLYNSLLSLNEQECTEPFEVIVADNGSEDGTLSMLESFSANFPLIFVRIKENRGIAYGRNQAVRNARGDILIFHDSDMLAEKDLVAKHIKAHENRDDLVVCGMFWKRIYSFYYDRFEKEHKEKLAELYEELPGDKEPLLEEGDIRDGSFLDQCFDLDTDFIRVLKSILEKYGDDLNGYRLPWRFFITNNSSVKRQHVADLGLFDEGIVRYGFEDYDLGIRLHQSGMRFQLRRDIMSVHQEHPSNCASVDDIRANIAYMCDKYNDIHSLDVHLAFNGPFDAELTNSMMADIEVLLDYEKYESLLHIFLELLHAVKDRNLDPDWKTKSPRITSNSFNLPEVGKLLAKAEKKLGVTHFVRAFKALAADLLHVDLK
ncbi:glycosyltransferase family 2 protein [Bacillus velezensis]|uniref:glycosyltransferase family 2 protein n=1 Tax=Bacillus amyloliquefaciens group TaxID=1938374 RepID=UPI00039608A8|nr:MULTISPECIES: glycosyltransferase family 2 protein [Bacillus amyloliquefaciens group]ERH51004.1 glycosyltransferase [Bacillus amyloliquefaciens EGD-AQ14]MEE4535741.1 glycosyltransferase family 2 protein [Bacillus velezensis]QWF29942.1 glycosyltransferase [Bacillus velezensis]THC35574.1 glycosyltransferase [Bacillus velezensis]